MNLPKIKDVMNKVDTAVSGDDNDKGTDVTRNNVTPPNVVPSPLTNSITKATTVWNHRGIHGMIAGGGTIKMKKGNTQLFIKITPISADYTEISINEVQMDGYVPHKRYTRPKVMKPKSAPKKKVAVKPMAKFKEKDKKQVELL